MPHFESKDTEIPVIDISNPSPEVAKEVLDAASTHGFLFIKNDGITIPPSDINEMFSLSQRFFHQPREQKADFAIHSSNAGGKNRGWVSMQAETLDPEVQKQGDPKEAFNIAEPHPKLQPLPPIFSSSEDLIARFQASCHALCKNILTLLGTALEIPDSQGGTHWLTTRHDQTRGPSGTIFRMLYYPKTPATEEGDSIRAGAHSDYGSASLLFRLPGQPGLEILKEDGSWAPVPVNPKPDELDEAPILVNIGDLLSFWTNGMLKSTVHRVTFSSGEERYSMAYFCHPLDEALLEAVPSKVIQEFGDRGAAEWQSQRKRLGLDGERGSEVLTAKQHLDRRLKVTYGLKD